MKKKNWVIFTTLSCIIALLLVLVIYLVDFVEPKIMINFSINPIVEADNKGREIIEEDQLISVSLKIKVVQPLFIITDKKLEVDELMSVISFDDKRIDYCGGKGFTDNDNSKPEVSYRREIKVKLREATIDELTSLFDNLKIKLSWNKLFIGREERTYYLKNYLVEMKGDEKNKE